MNNKDFKPKYFNHYRDGSCVYGYVSNYRELYPSTYLDYAKQDIGDNLDTRNRINAIGNAKRALHYQVELLCDAFGWTILYKNKNFGFPKRLEFLAQCGVLSPNILRKLNYKRNKIEHDYYIPTKEEVDDYIDISELFLMATKDLLHRFPEEIEFILMKDEYYETSLSLPKSLMVILTESQGKLEISWDDTIIQKHINDKDYFDWISSIMEQYIL
jgi:hypothetical protein